VDLKGRRVEGRLNPSTDAPTHLALYKAFAEIGGVAHTHSPYATMFAQACRPIPCLGTTHADHFHGEAPVTRALTAEEAAGDYEAATGRTIVERFGKLDPMSMPAVLVAHHGPFTWGADAMDSLCNSVALEAVALDTLAWHRKAGTLVRRDEVRSKVYMAASEAFDEMLARLKTTGLHLLEPEVIHSGTNYAGHLKMYAEDAGKRPYALALDCVGDYKESKITIHFFAESAELVMALREKVLAALAGK
jgi:ribulose-5-phosphate 4-epimerase/fuculose-1-phosphate aldolase